VVSFILCVLTLCLPLNQAGKGAAQSILCPRLENKSNPRCAAMWSVLRTSKSAAGRGRDISHVGDVIKIVGGSQRIVHECGILPVVQPRIPYARDPQTATKARRICLERTRQPARFHGQQRHPGYEGSLLLLPTASSAIRSQMMYSPTQPNIPTARPK
jgi:hypothetical protein